jgi:hypothetical protein
MQRTITTRPERTTDEIAADRKEANAFFARVYQDRNGERALKVMVAYHSYAEHLVHATIESEGFWRTRPNQAKRSGARQRQKAAQERENHRTANLVDHVDAAAKALLPTPNVFRRNAAERKRSYIESLGVVPALR